MKQSQVRGFGYFPCMSTSRSKTSTFPTIIAHLGDGRHTSWAARGTILAAGPLRGPIRALRSVLRAL